MTDLDARHRRARQRLITLIIAGVVLVFVACVSAFVFLSSLVWTRSLDANNDGEAVIEHLRQIRERGARGDEGAERPDAGGSAPPDEPRNPGEP